MVDEMLLEVGGLLPKLTLESPWISFIWLNKRSFFTSELSFQGRYMYATASVLIPMSLFITKCICLETRRVAITNTWATTNWKTVRVFLKRTPLSPFENCPFKTDTGLNLERTKAG